VTRGQRILVTGGAGFIGRALCARLCDDPRVHSVLVLDDLSSTRVAQLPRGVELVRGSVLDSDAVADCVHHADVIVHLAARSSVAAGLADPVGMYRVNALGTALVLDAARSAGAARVLVASSAAVYGNRGPRQSAEYQLPRPVSAYGASKAAAEHYSFAARAAHGLPVVVLRLFNVFGPGQDGGQENGPQDGAVMPRFVCAALQQRKLVIHGDGTQTRDFVYVEDVCEVMSEAALRGIEHTGPVNVGSGRGTSLRALAARVADVVGEAVECEHRPPRDLDVRHSCADTRLLRRLLPWFVPTDLSTGLRATVDWYRERMGTALAS
jgi:UDP-glucose 4-epimerase